MPVSASELYANLNHDQWRTEVAFSDDLQECQAVLLHPSTNLQEKEQALGKWLGRYQPCLFGRIAARFSLISYCFLTESDFLSPDSAIQEKIQVARTEWTRQAFEGKKSAFIILATSHKVANALPDTHLLAFVRRLCSLYLLAAIDVDKIYTDEVFLEKPGTDRTTWRWNVGVNYFAANADKRWWQDHRIPGGIGFSMNSVGHLVKSGIIATKQNELNDALGLQAEDLISTKVDSLAKALELAMKTIQMASNSISGKATQLLPMPEDRSELALTTCPVALPSSLVDWNYCSYAGYYHTDYTIPREYFAANVERPVDKNQFELDFTYLFYDSSDNPDFLTTGQGRRVRLFDRTHEVSKIKRSVAETVLIERCPRLKRAIEI